MVNKTVSLNWVAIYAGQTCVGHVLSRGPHGFEAFDADDQSVGLFETQSAAANALEGLLSRTVG